MKMIFVAASLLILTPGVRAQRIAASFASAPAAVAAPSAISASAAAATALPVLAASSVLAAAPSLPLVSAFAAAPGPVVESAAPPAAASALTAALPSAADGPKAPKGGAMIAVEPNGSVKFDGEAPSALGSGEVAAPRPLWKKVEVLDLHPTQANVGKIEVKKKAEKLEGMSREKAKEKLKSESFLVPVVVGPPKQSGGPERLYPNDHHHESAAALKAGFKHVYVTKVADLSHLSEDEFWAEMIKRKWVYLRSLGKPIDPSDLPKDMSELGDDVFRSVAGEVRDGGGYQKNTQPFSEFLWADFFRTRLKTDPDKDFKKAVAEGIALAKSDAAKDLPGWIGSK
jgi:hypothetical protein